MSHRMRPKKKLDNAAADPFARVHSLLRHGKLRKAFRMLVEHSSGRVSRPFTIDLNHAWYLVGDIHFRICDFRRAIKAFKNSLRSRPDDTECLMALANCHDKLNNARWSRHYLQIALESDPENPRLRYNLGNALLDLGLSDSAARQYVIAIETGDNEIAPLAIKNLKLARATQPSPDTSASTRARGHTRARTRARGQV
jgi:tetratricopeptide (TPR) repeat protein